MDSWERLKTTEKSFNYSAENPPPLGVLLDKLFAVHVTPILPKGGVMKAGARDVSHDGRHNGEEPPSFRPTIHFSLGEVVQSHGHHSWEEQPYAVVLPLRSLMPQLVNVFCNDTFVLGDFMVPDSAVVFVPQGTDCRSLPETISIVTYPATIPLRLVISDYIESMNAWHVKMNPESTSVGSQALVANTNINVPEFFKELFAHYPHVAFGSHINSERGEAYRFGLIEQCINLLMRGYDNGAPPLETDMIDLSIKLVVHNLTQLESMLKNVRSLPPDALAIFEQKKRAVYDWLAIANLDLYHRRTSGMSLNKRNQTLITQLKSNRKYPELFANIISTTPGAFDRVTEDTPLDPSMTAMMLAAMPPHEVNQFISHNQLLFAQLDKNNLYLLYAIERWTIVGSEKAHLENLDALVEVTLTHGTHDRQLHNPKDSPIMEVLKPYLRLDSARLATALEVLNIPSVRSHLEKKYGYTFPPSGVHSLEDVLRAHPISRILFQEKLFSVPPQQVVQAQLVYQLLGRSGPPSEDVEDLKTFEDAVWHAKSKLIWQQQLEQYIRELNTPLRETQPLSELIGGKVLTINQIALRGFPSIGEFWKQLGLKKEFDFHFPDQTLFWKSRLSLLEVHNMLQRTKEMWRLSD